MPFPLPGLPFPAFCPAWPSSGPVSAQGLFPHLLIPVRPLCSRSQPFTQQVFTEHWLCSGHHSECWGHGRSRQTESLPLGSWHSGGRQEKPKAEMCAMSDTNAHGEQNEPGRGSGRVPAKVRFQQRPLGNEGGSHGEGGEECSR